MGAQNAYSCTKFVVCSTGMVNVHMVDSDERKIAGVAQALLGQEPEASLNAAPPLGGADDFGGCSARRSE